MNRRIRTQRVIDCPREKRMVPLESLAAGANHAQLTCRNCSDFKKATCNFVTCKYEVTK